MLRHQFSQNLVLRLDLLLQILDSFLFGLMVLPYSVLESRSSVLEELLLPAIEYRRLEPQLIIQIRDRTPSTKCRLRMATFSSGV